MHPDIADDYREARRIRAEVVARASGGPDEGGPDEKSSEQTTEGLRQAIRKYQTVYERLVRG